MDQRFDILIQKFPLSLRASVCGCDPEGKPFLFSGCQHLSKMVCNGTVHLHSVFPDPDQIRLPATVQRMGLVDEQQICSISRCPHGFLLFLFPFSVFPFFLHILLLTIIGRRQITKCAGSKVPCEQQDQDPGQGNGSPPEHPAYGSFPSAPTFFLCIPHICLSFSLKYHSWIYLTHPARS